MKKLSSHQLERGPNQEFYATIMLVNQHQCPANVQDKQAATDASKLSLGQCHANVKPKRPQRSRKCFIFLKKMGHARPILVYLCSFQTQILQKNTVGFGGIQIRIIGVEGEHADHLTTTKARMHFCYPFHSLRTVYLFLYQSLF